MQSLHGGENHGYPTFRTNAQHWLRVRWSAQPCVQWRPRRTGYRRPSTV